MTMVFISYAREDSAIANRVYNDLTDANIEAWLDTRDVLPGSEWKLEIRRAIKRATHVLLLLSSRSTNKKGYVQKEIRLALEIFDEIPEGQIFLIPARIEQCEVRPERISEIQWVNLFPQYEAGFHDILKTLGVSQPPKRGASRLLKRNLLTAVSLVVVLVIVLSITSYAIFTVQNIPAKAFRIISPANEQHVPHDPWSVEGEAPLSAGIGRVEVQVNEAGWNLADGDSRWTYLATLVPGENHIYSRALNSAGIEIGTHDIEITYDLVDPSIEVDCSHDNSWTATTPLFFQGKAKDDKGIKSVVGRVNLGPWKRVAVEGKKSSWELELELIEGANSIQFKSIDKAGRESAVVSCGLIIKGLTSMT